MNQRRKRANGIASRNAILDATEQIAGERGYEGTSIKEVSERSGLPASSIYWHFENKDQLIAAVIDRSYNGWVDALTTGDAAARDLDHREAFVASVRQTAQRLTEFPDFLRLGLMLVLERRPDEPAARERFLQSRVETMALIRAMLERTFAGLKPASIERLASLTLAASDGLFIASDAEGADLVSGFETLAIALYGAANALGWHPPNPQFA